MRSSLAIAGELAKYGVPLCGQMETQTMKTPAREGHRHFQTTRWSVVRREEFKSELTELLGGV